MPRTLMTIDHLRRTQLNAITETNARLSGLTKGMPTISNAMFQLAQHLRLEGGSVAFNWWALNLLVSVPYTTTELFDLIVRASYFEATILYRHLLEATVQLRYYHEHTQRFESDNRWEQQRAGLKKGEPKGTRPSFKLMFEHVAPGHYEAFYSKWFSSAAHGGIVSSIFRFGMKLDEVAHTPGAHYDGTQAAFLLTHMSPILHGLLRMYVRLQPRILDALQPAARATVNEALQFFEQCSGEDWRLFPTKRPILEQLSGLADWPKPLSEIADLTPPARPVG